MRKGERAVNAFTELRVDPGGSQTSSSVVDNDLKRSAASGILALQIHAGPPFLVEFKNVRLTQYESKEKKIDGKN